MPEPIDPKRVRACRVTPSTSCLARKLGSPWLGRRGGSESSLRKTSVPPPSLDTGGGGHSYTANVAARESDGIPRLSAGR
jgi:hypothetical protein